MSQSNTESKKNNNGDPQNKKPYVETITSYKEAVYLLNLNYQKAKDVMPFFAQEYKKTQDNEKKLDMLFYWLIALLRISVTETSEAERKYTEFMQEFQRVLKIFLAKENKGINLIATNLFIKKYQHNFMQLSSLFNSIGNNQYVEEIYILSKDLEYTYALINKKWGSFIILLFDKVTSLYGTSTMRVAVHIITMMFLYSIILYLVDFTGTMLNTGDRLNTMWFDYLFTSMGILTNLGVSFVPLNTIQTITVVSGSLYGLAIFGLIIFLIGGRKR